VKALCWMGVNDLQVNTVADPRIVNPHDAILKVRLTTTCGSDLHLLGGYVPTMREGDVIGHEYMGEVVEVAPETTRLQVGDRVVVPSFIGCGRCWYCEHDEWSLCDNTHPKPELSEPVLGYPTAGIPGYSHAFGGYAGSHAEYIRVPHADVNCFKIPEGVTDEQALFLSDAVPTGYMGADFCNIQPGDTVAVWGCGPVGQFAIRSAKLLGAEQVVAIDDRGRVPERLKMAEDGGAITIDMRDEYVYDKLLSLTGGRGPDACIDAVGMEAHGFTADAFLDKVKAAVMLATDRPHALRQAINCCRKGGTVSVPGVYGGFVDKLPFGAAMQKGLQFRMGQTHVHKYVPILTKLIEEGKIDPSFVITHKMPLSEAPHGYQIFRDKQDGCIKIVLKPGQ